MRYPSEIHTYVDPLSGRTVRQLTAFRGHSHHLYFTNPGWWDNGKRLLFGSDRAGRRNLFSVELESGEITQHTDSDMPGPPLETSFMATSLNPRRPECTFWRGADLMSLDLKKNRETKLWTCPDGFTPSNQDISADGKVIYFGISEDLSRKMDLALLQGYVGMVPYFEARPLCRLMRFDFDTARAEVLLEDKCWFGHINSSPTQPHLFTFCHEGPWDSVDHRIWVFDASTGNYKPICPRLNPGQMIGHEYWLDDGVRIGYHGYDQMQECFFFGCLHYDGTQRRHLNSKISTGHTYSQDFSLVIGDGDLDFEARVLRLFPVNGESFEAPRILCRHDSTFRTQQMHPHPRFSPDGKKAIFTSDCSSYGQVYEVEIGDWQDLPLLEETGRTVEKKPNDPVIKRVARRALRENGDVRRPHLSHR